MNDRLRHWLRVCWFGSLLVVFGAAFGGSASDGRRVATGVECETALTGDVAELERCVGVVPDDVDQMIALGAAYESAGRHGEAEGMYRRALALDARNGDAHLGLGQALLRLGDSKAARSEADAALALQPGNPAALGLIERAASGAAR